MDKLNELSHGAKVVLGAAIAFLLVSFFSWFKYTAPARIRSRPSAATSASRCGTGWAGSPAYSQSR